MIIIIPLGGIGSRFRKKGYRLPKPLINVMGKPIICWLIDNLVMDDIDCIVIPYNKELLNYRFESILRKKYPKYNFKFIALDRNTGGAAETLYIALSELEMMDCPVLSLDGDSFYLEDLNWKGENCVYCFNDISKEEIYSYVKVDNDGKIVDIMEKRKISDNACSGGYGFKSWMELKKYCKLIIDSNIKQKGEFYTSTVIKEMLGDGLRFEMNIVGSDNFICLGTPLHVRIFCNNFPRINAINGRCVLEGRRYCFDLDNTLVTFPLKEGDYTSVLPIERNINFVKYLKKLGHTIVIYTARRMKTHGGNVGRIMADIGKITFDTLYKFEIPYDELYFGKPLADYYIDDLGVNAFSDLEKELGYYQSTVDPRHFNTIKNFSIDVCRKESDDLSGEIHWYRNMPNEIKDMFPMFFRYDEDGKWYEMERMKGIPVSKLFLSEDMTEKQLGHIMGSIERIHECEVEVDVERSVDIHQNYLDKLKRRYKMGNYSEFEGSKEVYERLVSFLKEYKGKRSVIHGDPVFTNILINQFGKIKFIDMRGKQGDELSIEGDWLYDWAKIYQSLVGYDEILEGKMVGLGYKRGLIEYFERRFLEKYGEEDLKNMKMITNLLLFTLIPLHQDKEKCKGYYELIK